MNKILNGLKVNKSLIKLTITLSLLLIINCKKDNNYKEFLNGVTEKKYPLLLSYFEEEVNIETGPLNLGKFSRKDGYQGFNLNKGYLYALFFDTKEWVKLSGNGNIAKESIYDCLKNKVEIKFKKDNISDNVYEDSMYLSCSGETKTLKFNCKNNMCKLQSIWLNEEF
ncbi:hypothetical protein M9Y82_19260 [Leptospira weilii]|uniref:hypothetical protein n=1 Tax=Leptospira weilii TaxID=28184 RepID=UPI000774863F|nr:hypothetical protein [Leptospira weilii]MCL8268726.1 hypothetical protein [Leptospira weilii]MDL5247569.1 hypothetical protein [Leptospira weilii]ULH27697.1 hypothetical protein FH586_14990 [Leptospira weilii]UPY77326.1 hypothetical protein FH581_000270 [Leptospira weilii]